MKVRSLVFLFMRVRSNGVRGKWVVCCLACFSAVRQTCIHTYSQAILEVVTNKHICEMMVTKQSPEFVLFGASMTEWSFRAKTQGLGWFWRKEYEGRVQVLNEGIGTTDIEKGRFG